MPLTLAQKSNVRRHLGYPVAGLVRNSVAGGTLATGAAGWRFTQAFGFLEYKLNNLNPDEEARLTGYAYGSLIFVGPFPAVGDSVGITLSGGPIASPQTLTVTYPINNGGQDGKLWFAQALAAACSLNPVLQAAGVVGVSPFGTGAFSQNAVPLAEVAFTCAVPFNFVNPTGTGIIAPQITSDGALLEPYTSLDGDNNIAGYLPILNGLEGAYAATSQNLDTISADVWHGRSNEAGARASLYESWRGLMSDFLDTPINPHRRNNMRRTGALRFA